MKFTKLSFTLSLSNEQALLVLRIISGAKLNNKYSISVNDFKNGGYYNTYQIGPFNGETVNLGLCPINNNHDFVRIEYDSHKLGCVGIKALMEFLVTLLGDNLANSIYYKARITRLNVEMNISCRQDLFLYKDSVRFSTNGSDKDLVSQYANYNIQETNRIAEQVVGSRNSKSLVTMCNMNVGLKISKRINIALNQPNCLMAQLGTVFANELKNINFVKADLLKDSRISDRFKIDTYVVGLNSALYLGQIDQYPSYKKIISEYIVGTNLLAKDNIENAHHEAFSTFICKEYYEHLAELAEAEAKFVD